ncbi:hypothetical protein PsorP6_013713 [Peronosclerospora sorghi]|uniref:Uncharacterized protein n=1 Tax=Peronosclerospora sorghi TaxID=230839 RepID=A0ACC0VIL1_9STRA|nr:hypothetical protein PsorP6_013713 [Peronosclerospora sorghi]
MLNLQEKKHRFTPLMLALAQQPPSFEEIFQTLLKGKPDLNVQDSSGQTVLHLATGFIEKLFRTAANDSEDEEETVLKLLLKANANVNAVDMKKMTALHIAVGKGNLEIVQLLIETGRANVNAVDGKGIGHVLKTATTQLEMISYFISKLNSEKLLSSFVIAIGQGAKPLRNKKRSSIRTALLQHVQLRHKLSSTYVYFVFDMFYATNVAAIAHSKKRVVKIARKPRVQLDIGGLLWFLLL